MNVYKTTDEQILYRVKRVLTINVRLCLVFFL